MNTLPAIHRLDAFRLLEDGGKHTIRAWKKNGTEIVGEDVKCVGRHIRGGVRRYLFTRSGALRAIRDCLVFEVDGMEVYW